MDKNSYLDILKGTNLRPKKVKPAQVNQTYLAEQTEMNKAGVESAIIKWFMKNPKPLDKEVHEFSDSLGINTHEFETYIYAILGNILTGGKSKGFTGKYDEAQLQKGIKVESEHTDFPEIAEKISRDHLSEIPDYYDRLAKMEAEAGIKD